ncbi:molybdopterin-guanine dinucleotide biosynthesis protein B [Aeromonas aquatica]|uniref:molybdopterin-guanine dinucleotide biosynthesis protein B n=1 Tax=Aeromonas aquatica TaxID=558964 RepID=UPI00051BCCE5|nr:molybdopterin-guanine dinucleotide biosynthesis protein B [Aeromonas aquatica]
MTLHLPLLGFVAWSGTGKTTLLERLIPLLNRRGLRLGVLKHTHHQFDIDQPGKDSHRLRKAGAGQVMAASSLRHARIVETPDGETPFADLLAGFDWERLDLLLIEGFKHEHFPKIELHRGAIGRPLLFPDDPDVMALISDSPQRSTLPCFDFEALDAIADFICHWLAERSAAQDERPSQPAVGSAERQPLRLIARALVAIPAAIPMATPGLKGDDLVLPGHLEQDANGILRVRPTHALISSTSQQANCLIERPACGRAMAPGERVWIRLLPD